MCYTLTADHLTAFLRLSADDGTLVVFDELTVTVDVPNTIRVPQDQPIIQAGIDAAQAGEVVLVPPGTYLRTRPEITSRF